MRRLVVVAMIRKDMTERIVALFGQREEALRAARRYAAVHSGRIIRLRVRPVGQSASQVEAICFEWGRADGEDGEPLRAKRLRSPMTTPTAEDIGRAWWKHSRPATGLRGRRIEGRPRP